MSMSYEQAESAVLLSGATAAVVPGETLTAKRALGARRSRVLTLAIAQVVALLAPAVLLAGAGRPGVFGVVGALHLAAVAAIVVGPHLAPSERWVAFALTLSLPVVGPAVAAVVLCVRGRGELAQPSPDDLDAARPMMSLDEVRGLADGLPSCDALLAGTVEERRAILAALSRRGDARAVALLRWALAAPDPELAVDAALALEDLNAAFEARLSACRAELAESPSFAAAIAAADTIAHAVEAGIVEASVIPTLVEEARRCYAAAGELEPARLDVIAARRARLELAALCPDAALDLIDEVSGSAGPGIKEELAALRQEAVLASHSLPWEGPSMLASYRPPLVPPPPHVRRTRTAARADRPLGVFSDQTVSDVAEGGDASAERLSAYAVSGLEVSRDGS